MLCRECLKSIKEGTFCSIKCKKSSLKKELKPWEVVKFSWGTAVRHSKGKWEKLFLYPNAEEVDVSDLKVVLHDNGIEFL